MCFIFSDDVLWDGGRSVGIRLRAYGERRIGHDNGRSLVESKCLGNDVDRNHYNRKRSNIDCVRACSLRMKRYG